MAKPLYLVIPSGGMKEYEKFERLFSFYPEGVQGLIKDYLSAFAKPEYLQHLRHDDISVEGSDGVEEPQQEVFAKVMKLYEASDDYRAKLHIYPNCQDELLIEILCEEIYQKAWHVIEEHIDVFANYTCEVSTMEWMGDSMILKAKKFVPLSWF